MEARLLPNKKIPLLLFLQAVVHQVAAAPTYQAGDLNHWLMHAPPTVLVTVVYAKVIATQTMTAKTAWNALVEDKVK